MSVFISLLKWLFPHPSTDLRAFILSVLVCGFTSYAFIAHGKNYIDNKYKKVKLEISEKHNEVKKELVVKENLAKTTIESESKKIMLVLNFIKSNMHEMKKEIKETNEKVWELSRSKQ